MLVWSIHMYYPKHILLLVICAVSLIIMRCVTMWLVLWWISYMWYIGYRTYGEYNTGQGAYNIIQNIQ